MKPSGTVFERMQGNGGYMTGPRHAMGPALADMQSAPPAAPAPDDAAPDPAGDKGPPPNLRDASSTVDSCGDCGNFSGQGQCDLYDTAVQANQVCDSFEMKGDEAAPEADQSEMEPK